MKIGYPFRASARTRRRREWYRESAHKLTRELPAPRLGASEPAEQNRDADAPASAGTTLHRRCHDGTSARVSHVAMESTGVSWRPVFYVLEEACTCVLANATQIAQVPGRKTDVNDAVWIAQLLEHGLIRPSFVPPAPIRELRDLTRYRKLLIQERTRHANRLHKVLEDAGITLTSVATRLLGASGRGDQLHPPGRSPKAERPPGGPAVRPQAKRQLSGAPGPERPEG